MFPFAVRYCSRVAWALHFDTDEAVGDGLEELVRASQAFDGTGSFKSFACQRMRWRIIDGHRRRHGRKRGPNEVLPDVADRRADLDTAIAAREALRKVATLRPRDREVVTRRISGEDNTEIAAALGVSVSRIGHLQADIETDLLAA